ncbi:NAD(P)/FAD-dependent oxidoreductase [Pedobacter sp. L105]|uniref:flavin monoamine oxidase family protein n=1 Tax=Pedobacter sp. L105 TaxID=1641871 RepID=UPI00131C7E11|nr:NAD(P)/FAD-dependent oxidoreductase [Pedobacter sp. L105]
MKKKKLIIAGGGISGLVAARELAATYEIILLEALPRFGGRIYTINNEVFPRAIEAGAEFVHGKAEESIKLLNEAGISFVKTGGKSYHLQNTKLVKEGHHDPSWDDLIKKMATVQQDITLLEFLDLHFKTGFDKLRQQVITFAQGFDLADITKVSVKSLYQEWAHQGEDYRVSGGYGQLIKFLVADCKKKGCALITNTRVKKVQWEEGYVQVFAEDETVYEADRCLITLPLGILQSEEQSLVFVPPIAEYNKAFHQIGFGSVIKFILLFRHKFWKDDAAFFHSSEEIPTWWTQFPEHSPFLTGWAGGPKAIELSAFSSDELLEKALNSLSAIFNLPMEEIKAQLITGEVFNWHREKSFSGAYSYATPATAGALVLLNEPIQQTLFFAGEAFYAGDTPGTVEATIVSANQVVKKLS